MPGYKELMRLIRQGKSPDEILQKFRMPPSKFRRMLNGKQIQAYLQLEEELAAEIVGHKTAAGILPVAERLRELMRAENVETSRKVCIALLSEGLRNFEADHLKDQSNAQLPPWKLLEPANSQATPQSAGPGAPRPDRPSQSPPKLHGKLPTKAKSP